MSNSSKTKLDDCPLPAVIKKSPSSRKSGSPEPTENREFQTRTRASSWDESDDETPNPQTDKTQSEEVEKDGKSQDTPDRRQSPARIRRRRRSSSGSSIISENALDEKFINEIKQVGDVIHEKVENSEILENVEIKKEDKVEERILMPKKLPPVDLNHIKKNCPNPEILQELSKNLLSEPKGKRKDHKKDLRAKSSDLEKTKKEKCKFPRPESEKIVRNNKSRNNSSKLVSPKILPEITLVEEIALKPEVEFQTINLPKTEERPKSASFLIMEDLEDVDENEIYKNECKKTSRTDRTKSAGASSSNSYQWKVSEKSSSCGIEFLTSGESSASKISDIHNWSGRESEASPKRSFDSERWCQNFSGSRGSFSRTEKSPYSERGQLTSPSDSNEKSVDSEYTVKKTQIEKESSPCKTEKLSHKDLIFPPETTFIGLGDSKDVQCWNVGKPKITGIEEPQDHGDGNFRQLTNEETWQQLMLQVEEEKNIKSQSWSELKENLNKPDDNSWILKAKDEKFNKREDSQSPKKSKWSLVGGTVAKPMSSSSDASTQCTILQDKEPSSRKRKREQLVKSRIIREEVVIEKPPLIENEKIVKKIQTPKKKEVTFDYNEITICEKEESNEVENFLILRKSREKEMTDYKNFLAKNEHCKSRLKSKNDFRKKLQLWKSQRCDKDDNTEECEKNLDDKKKTKFYDCACFQVFCRVVNSFFKTGR